MLTIEYAKDLKWCNAEYTLFECIVKYEEFVDEMPCGVNAVDPYSHIQELWTKGIAGEYGPIAEYVPPAIPTQTAEPVTPIEPGNTNG